MIRFCFHDWNKWSELVASYSGHKTQFRECTKCGRAQFRDLGYCDGTDTHQANEALRAIRNFEVKV